MFKFIALILLFTILSADYTPNWQSCSDPSDSWHPTSVTFANQPVHGQSDNVTLCGESVDDFSFDHFQYKVKILDIVVYSGIGRFNSPQNVTAGETTCLQFNFTIPKFVIGTIQAQFIGLDTTGSERGCVQVDVSL